MIFTIIDDKTGIALDIEAESMEEALEKSETMNFREEISKNKEKKHMQEWKYFVVTATVKDCDNEYMQQNPVMAMTPDLARATVKTDLLEWIGDDDSRTVTIDNCVECSKSEFEILSKYIYQY